MNDVKVSHANKDVVYKVIKDLDKQYGKIVLKYGPKVTFVGIDIVFTDDSDVDFSIGIHIQDAIDDFTEEITTKRTVLQTTIVSKCMGRLHSLMKNMTRLFIVPLQGYCILAKGQDLIFNCPLVS